MKTLITSLFSVFITLNGLAQTDKLLTKENWKPGKEKIIYGHNVLRIEGKNDKKGITNLAYQSQNAFMADLEKKPENDKWQVEKKKAEIEEYQKSAAGGVLHFYITRLTIHDANTNLFTIAIKDSLNNEILNKDLESDVPEAPLNGSDYWSNYISLPISKKVAGKIYVYVIERSEPKREFKFEVKL